MFEKILIADRGEIAVRIIRACKEMKIETVAVYSEADRNSLHVRLADEAVCVGPAEMRESYLHDENILMAAHNTGAEAIHPGYGGLAEKALFAEKCAAWNIKFIGPPPEAMEKMSRKSEARKLMQKAHVPVIPGTECVGNGAEVREFVQKVGFPVILKAAAGGGGRGLRVVHDEQDLERSLRLARQESEAAFNDGSIYVEKYLSEPRHIEVQILAESPDNCLYLGERECSIQTARYQKMLEETPCAALSPQQRVSLCRAAVNAAKAAKYVNAGTVEFLLDRDGNFYFMEMNTRIQVEHPVTELVTRMDLIKEQIRIAAGEKRNYRQKDIRPLGHALECRITAQDPDRQFMPCAGKVRDCWLPGGNGIRVDTHIYPGYEVPAFYDPLLAKVIAWGNDREEAIHRMERALEEMRIEGLPTTQPFHQRILANAFFRKGETYTNFIQRRLGVGI